MKSTIYVLMAITSLLSIVSYAQPKNAKTESVKVAGNCGSCQSKIEKAGNVKNESEVSWNKDTKVATLTYDSKKTSKDEILKRIALSGYDNEMYLAPDDVYEKLPVCCHYDREKKANAPTDHSNHAMASTDHSATNGEIVESTFDKVLTHYLSLKDALVQSNGELASRNAALLLDALTAIKMEALKGDSHTAWMKVKSALIEDSEHISETKDISHQRDHFNSLSKNMYTLLKASSTGTTLYYQHCPMYNDGKGGDWLSKESTVKNPFYGSQMLSCGKTVETLKQ